MDWSLRHVVLLVILIGFGVMPAHAAGEQFGYLSVDSTGCEDSDFKLEMRTNVTPGVSYTVEMLTESGGLVYMDLYYSSSEIENGDYNWKLFNSNSRGLQTATFPLVAGQSFTVTARLYDAVGALLYQNYLTFSSCETGNISNRVSGATTQLTDNPDFEVAGESTSEAADWQVKNATKDKRKCNKGGKPPVAHSGECAFVFKGNPEESANLQQKYNSPDYVAEDLIELRMWAKASNLGVDEKSTVTIKYGNNKKEKINITIPGGTYDYQPLVGNFTSNKLETPSSVKIKIAFRNTSGKLFVDEVQAVITHNEDLAENSGLIPLPAAP